MFDLAKFLFHMFQLVFVKNKSTFTVQERVGILIDGPAKSSDVFFEVFVLADCFILAKP